MKDYNTHLANVMRKILSQQGDIMDDWLTITRQALHLTADEKQAIYDEYPRLNQEIDNEVEKKEEVFHE